MVIMVIYGGINPWMNMDEWDTSYPLTGYAGILFVNNTIIHLPEIHWDRVEFPINNHSNQVC